MIGLFTRAIKLARRDPARAWLVIRIAGWIVVLSCVVKFLSLPRALRLLSPDFRNAANHNRDYEDLASAVDAVLNLDRLMFRPSCWKRAAVLHRYLALRGVPTTIVFGLKKEDGALKGHAWLESEGRAILESDASSYHVTYSFPSNQSFEGDLAIMAE